MPRIYSHRITFSASDVVQPGMNTMTEQTIKAQRLAWLRTGVFLSVIVSLICGAALFLWTSGQQPSISGRIAFSSNEWNWAPNIFSMNVDGSDARQLTHYGGLDDEPAWSPDGRRLAFISSRSHADLYVMNADGSHPVPLTTGLDVSEFVWSPDGRRIAFTGHRNETRAIYIVDTTGSGLMKLNDHADSPAWSPDGRRIAFHFSQAAFDSSIFVINPDGSGLQQVTDQLSWAPMWSPDGTSIAFIGEGNEAGDLYVMPSDGSAAPQLLHPNIDAATWSPDSQRLAFTTRGLDNSLFVIHVDGSQLKELAARNDGIGPPVWSPAGEWIAFTAVPGSWGKRGTLLAIYVVRADGSGLRQITKMAGEHREPAWQPQQ